MKVQTPLQKNTTQTSRMFKPKAVFSEFKIKSETLTSNDSH